MPPAIARPGATSQPSPYADMDTLVTDPALNAQIQAVLPGIMAHAPQGYGAMGHQGGMNSDEQSAWLTGQLRAAGVPLEDGQHVMGNGQVLRDQTFWEKYKYPILMMAAGAGGGLALSALTGEGVLAGGAAGAASGGGATAGGLTTGGVIKGATTGAGLLKTLAGSGNALAQTAAQIEAGRAGGNVAQAKLQQTQDQLAQNRALLALRAPGIEAGNSVRGDVLANSQDASFSGLPSYIHIPNMQGGLRPSMLSQNSRDLGGVMSRNALAHQMSGDDVPNLTPLPQSNGLDTTLQGIGLGGSFLNALGGLGGKGGTGTDLTAPQYGNLAPWQGPINQPDPTLGMPDQDLAWWQDQANGGGA